MAKSGEVTVKITADTTEFDRAMDRLEAKMGTPKRHWWADALDTIIIILLFALILTGHPEVATACGVVLLVMGMLRRERAARRRFTRRKADL